MNKQTTGSRSSPTTINSVAACTVSPIIITIKEHDSISLCDPTITDGYGSSTAVSTCDLISVEGCASPARLDTHDHTIANKISGDKGGLATN